MQVYFNITYVVVWLLCDNVADTVNEMETRAQVPLAIIAFYDCPDIAFVVPLDIEQLRNKKATTLRRSMVGMK